LSGDFALKFKVGQRWSKALGRGAEVAGELVFSDGCRADAGQNFAVQIGNLAQRAGCFGRGGLWALVRGRCLTERRHGLKNIGGGADQRRAIPEQEVAAA